jgi:hypothetical protein
MYSVFCYNFRPRNENFYSFKRCLYNFLIFLLTEEQVISGVIYDTLFPFNEISN